MLESNTLAADTFRFAATDMLHRRVSLPSHFYFVLGERAVRIKTDSRLIGKAIRSAKLRVVAISESASVEWEIAVEVCGDPLALGIEAFGQQVETCWFGPSCSARLADGSWFAHTPPSLNGVGFAMVTGDEWHQVQQLSLYLRTILSFVVGNSSRSVPSTECEVPI